MAVRGHSAHVWRGIRAPAGQQPQPQPQPSGGKFQQHGRKVSKQGGCVEGPLLSSNAHIVVGKANPGVEVQSR